MTLNKYQEVMERLTVTPEQRARTLKAVEQGVKRSRKPKLLRLMPLAAAAVLVLALLPMSTQLLRRTSEAPAADMVMEQAAEDAAPQEAAEVMEQDANAAGEAAPGLQSVAKGSGQEAAETEEAVLAPQEVQSAAELEQQTGLKVPELTNLPFEAESVTYTAYGDLAEITYEGAGRTLCWRVSAGTGDNSGDYTDYARVEEQTLAGDSVTVKGDGAGVALALWSNGEQSYSLSAEPELTQEELTALLEGLEE